MQENKSGYKPVQKGMVAVFIANTKEEEKIGNLYRVGDMVRDEISRRREGILVEATEGCFEEFSVKPQIGDRVSFRGYSGEIYENGEDFYRIFEDKFVVAIVNK